VNSPSAPAGSKLYFRGKRNLDATLDMLFEQFGLGSATELVVTGGSAGGLSTFLHSDHIRSRMPAVTRVTAAPVVGYFLDHPNEVQSSSNYTAWMAYIYSMQNISAALHPDCLSAYPSEPYKCFMAPHMVSFVTTPFFMFNSRFDQWQLDNILQVNQELLASGRSRLAHHATAPRWRAFLPGVLHAAKHSVQ
jgi:hypothetical protein